jgi:ubiquitin carboxyl-terminal hydrolase 4/11/15
VYPRSFKYALGKHAEQFLGYDQHDSQELATFLLDALHEDTNRVTKKPYIEKAEQGELETDDEAAKKSWELHLKRENSRVLENFMGQVKSRVECPRPGCGRVSTTFDPFMYLSVPIPGVTDRSISFVYVPLNPCHSSKEFHVVVNRMADVLQLRQAIATTLNQLAFDEPVYYDDLVVTEVYNNEVFSFFPDNAEVSRIRDQDKIFVFRVSPSSVLSHEFQSVNLTNPPHLPLDKATVAELTVDDKWRSTLERYLKQPLSLAHVLNPKRSSLEERLDFLERTRTFLERCFKSPECVAYRKQWERQSQDDATTGDSMVSGSIDDFNDVNEISLEERCANSSTFKGMRSAIDVATLEFCARKLFQLCRESQTPGEIQVVFVRPIRFSYTSCHRDETLGYPFVLRISASLTVFELRKILADHLSPYIVEEDSIDEKFDDSMQDDTLGSRSSRSFHIMRQVHLQYIRDNSSSRFTYRTLGVGFHTDDNHNITSQVLASPSDEAELKSVLDVVGNQGKIVVSLPDHIAHRNLDIQNMFKIENGRRMQEATAMEENCTVLQCIKKYCQKEQLEETDMWYCDRCREHVPAWKQIGLYRLPPILIIHLKRFHFSAHSHRRSKIETQIDFPLNGLDLRDEAKHWLQGEEPIYDCYALTNHYGGLGGGHYTAFAQNDDGEWCGFDDSRVTTGLSTSSIITPAAYVLYYKRRDVTLTNDGMAIDHSSLSMDIDDERKFTNEVSMDKSSPSGETFPVETSSLCDELAAITDE